MPLHYSHLFSALKKLHNDEQSRVALLAGIVGVIGGFGAVLFRSLINVFQSLFYGSSHELLNISGTIPWFYKIWLPAAGGLIVGPIIYFFAREAKGHGVPEVIEAVTLKSGLIRKRLVLVKALTSAICIGSGGSAGREGPIVQIGSAIGSTLGQYLKVSASRMRTLAGCGAAAGIAATFNAPIAGSMFALEIILGDFGLATFSPIVISSVVATAISRHFLGNSPAFIVPSYELVSVWEFPLYVILGLFCALVGVTFTKSLYWTEDLFDRIKFPDYFKAVLGGFGLGLLALVFPHILGVGYGAIDQALAQTYVWWLLLLLATAKILATSITIGSGGSGGIFAPSLFVGVMAGGFMGTLFHHLFPSITASPGAYAIVGMGAVVSATTHGPMSAILILFEMTSDYKIILPLMITCIISTAVARQLLRDSIYTFKLIRKGIDIQEGKEVNILKGIPVTEVMNRDVETVYEGLPLKKLADKISKSKYNSFPMVDSKNRLAGVLSFFDYNEALFDEDLRGLVVARDLATLDVVTVSTDENLYDAFEKISSKDFSLLPVVAPDSSFRLIGIITRRDIVGAYDKAVMKKSLNITENR